MRSRRSVDRKRSKKTNKLVNKSFGNPSNEMPKSRYQSGP